MSELPRLSATGTRYRGTALQRLLIAAAVVYMTVLVVVPLLALFGAAFRRGASALWDVLFQTETLTAIGFSLTVAAIATVVNTVFGVAGAMVVVRQQFRGRRIFDAAIDLPLAMSPVMIGFGLLLVYGRNGLLAPLLQAGGVRVAFAPLGVVLATLFVTLPFAIRQAGHVLALAGTIEEQAAATLGASAWQQFWYVTVPNMKYGLIFGATLTAARALGEFGAVLIVGGAISGRTSTATSFIYSAFEERQEVKAFGVALVLSAASISLLVLLKVVGRGLRAKV